MNTFAAGQRVRLSVLFETAAGVATDPTDVALEYWDPRGTKSTKTYALAEVVKDSTGNYHYDVDVSVVGRWFYKYSGTGTLVAAGAKTAFQVVD